MGKRIMAFILAILIIGSTAVYADEGDLQKSQTTEPAQSALVLDAQNIQTTESTQPIQVCDIQNVQTAELNEPAQLDVLIVEHQQPDTVSDEQFENNIQKNQEENLSEIKSKEKTFISESNRDIFPADISNDCDEKNPTDEKVQEEIVILEEGDDLEEDSEQEILLQNENPTSQNGISITKFSYEKVKTNEDYHYLSFQFTNGENEPVYDAFITGLTISVENDYDFNTCLMALMEDIAKNFYDKTPMKLQDKDDDTGFITKYHLKVSSIDAEKQDRQADKSNPDSDSDQKMCWAASASNMLELTGWRKVANEQKNLSFEPFENEDEVFQYFEESFTDIGSTASDGIKWFFNGINPRQEVLDDEGKISYANPADTPISPSQQKQRDNKAVHDGNLIPYAAEEVVTEYDYSKSESASCLYDAAMGLNDGNAAGLGVSSWSKKSGKYSLHAITLFGYIKDAVSEGLDSLKALFITNSDDNKFETDNRAEIVNTVTMYTLDDTEYKGEETKYLYGYRKKSAGGIIVATRTLEAYNGSIPEDTGNHNAITTPDYTVQKIEITSQDWGIVKSVEAGEEVTLSATVKNSSYAFLSDKENAIMRGSFIIYKDGKEIDRVSVETELTEDSKKALGEMTNVSSHYHFENGGDYQVTFSIEGIYLVKDDEYEQIEEAFYLNNLSKFLYNISVKGDPNDNPEIWNEQSFAVDTYSAVFFVSKVETYKIKIKKPIKNIATIVFNNTRLDPKMWTVTNNGDGTVTISFDKEFISNVFPGSYLMKLLDAEGNIVAMLDIEIR